MQQCLSDWVVAGSSRRGSRYGDNWADSRADPARGKVKSYGFVAWRRQALGWCAGGSSVGPSVSTRSLDL